MDTRQRDATRKLYSEDILSEPNILPVVPKANVPEDFENCAFPLRTLLDLLHVYRDSLVSFCSTEPAGVAH